MKHLVRSGLLATGVAAATLLTSLASAPASAAYRFTTDDGKSLLVTGFLREHASMNLENHPEADATGTHRLNGRGELSMLRSTFKLDLKADLGWMQAVAIYRKDYEYQTAYLDKLKKTTHAGTAGQGPGGRDFMDVIQGDQIREAYIVVNPTERIRATLGKQQIVWGETDFFRAMDIINGFDLRWRSFLETENEELRKPLIMANVEIEVPEWNGQLQLVYRPGWDNAEDVGNDIDISGGRWATQATKGVPFLPLLPFNYNRGSDDTSDANYGFRWVGDYQGISYSLNYWRGLNPDPIANPGTINPFVPGALPFAAPPGGFATAIGGLRGPFGSLPRSNGTTLGELIRPKIETFGATASGYLSAADIIYRMELAFTPNKPYNVGKNVGISLAPVAFGGIGGTLWVPGLGGVVERDTLVSMIGVDKQMKGWSDFLGTSQFPLLSFQLFDTWVTNFHKSDQIVETLGFGALRKEHTTLLTGLLQLNYEHNTINPSFAGVVDLTNKDFVLIPALELVFGDHWRIRTDADLFFAHASKNVKRQQIPGLPPGATAFVNEDFYAPRPEDDTHLLGTFANNSQFNVRITYQF